MTEPLWTHAAPPPALRSVPAGGRRRFAVAAVAAAVFGVLAGVATWVRPVPEPYYVPLWVTQYSSPAFPPTPATEADREAVRNAGLFLRGPDTYASQEANLLLRELQNLADRPADDRVLVYVCGYAVPAVGDEVHVYPADADPTREPLVIPLSTILQRLADCPARDKLLVLDLIEPLGDVRVGGLRADVPARVPALLAKAAPAGGLLVLCPCGPGQRTHVMPAAERTAFGYYFELGLRGSAKAFYRPDHAHDHRVSARELARYVQQRVDRWASENRGLRQTPQLYGDGEDFDLTAPGRAVGTPAPPVAAADPAWLTDGWAELERWRTDGILSESPRLYQRLLAAVVRADAGSRGPTAARAATELAFARKQIDDDLQAARARIPRPSHPATLALAERYGDVPDAALRAAAAKLLADVRGVPPGKPDAVKAAVTKLLDAFNKAAAPASTFAFEDAVYAAAVTASEGRPDLLQLLDQALAARGEPPRSAEARFLQRVATLSTTTPADRWPAELARLGLRAVGRAEQATARPDLYAWAGGVMDACAQARTEGELLLSDWPAVATDDVGVRFRRADALADALAAFGDAVRAGRRAADEVLVDLGPVVVLQEAFPDREPLWRERLAATLDLLPALNPPASPIAEADLLPRGDDLRRRTDRLRRATAAVRGGGPGAATTWLVGRAARPDAGPLVLTQLEVVLREPSLPVADRTALVAARLALAGRLDAATRQKDAADDAAELARDTAPLTATESAEERTAEARRAAGRAASTIAILRLAGLPEADLAALAKLRDAGTAGGPDAPAWDQLADALRVAWGDGLRRTLAEATADRLDVLAAVFPGDEPAPRLDDPPGGPQVAGRAAAAATYLAWLGERYRYAARAGFDAAAFEAALADLGPYAGPAGGPALDLRGPTGPIALLPQKPVAEVVLALARSAAVTDPPRVRVLLPDDSVLTVTADLTDLPLDPAAPGVRRSTLRLKVATDTFPLPTGTTGFVVECRVGNRAVFARVGVAFGPAVPPVDLIVSTVASPPEDAGDAIRLRPSEAPQPFFLFARNGGSDARGLTVQASGPFPPADAKVTAAPGTTVPVNLPAAAPPAGTPPAAPAGTDLPTTMRLQLVSDDKAAAVLRDRTLQFSIADPLEYVELVDASFTPADPPAVPVNRLRVTLRARRALGPTPCTAELVLDPANIPGFGGVKLARLKGQLAPDGTPLTLEAEGLALDPAADEDGAVTLTLDGVADAVRFRVVFARFGSATVPALDLSPRVRLALDPPPAPGQSVKFRAAADRAPQGTTLEARLLRADPDGAAVVERVQKYPAPRQARAAFAIAAGGFTVQPSVRDWDTTWQTPQSVGKRTLEVRLLSAAGVVLAVVDKPLTLDTSAPTGVKLVGLPAKAKAGAPFTARAEGSDPESGVQAVKFFLGKPVNGQPPPGAAVAAGVPDADVPGTWQAQLTPGDKIGPADVSVIFENGAGLVASDSGSVDVVAQLPVVPGGIAGVVTEGPRPQAGLEVTLADAKGTAVKTATTGDDGSYKFDALAPGKYTVSVTKSSSRRAAKKAVTVEAGQTATVPLPLFIP